MLLVLWLLVFVCVLELFIWFVSCVLWWWQACRNDASCDDQTDFDVGVKTLLPDLVVQFASRLSCHRIWMFSFQDWDLFYQLTNSVRSCPTMSSHAQLCTGYSSTVSNLTIHASQRPGMPRLRFTHAKGQPFRLSDAQLDHECHPLSRNVQVQPPRFNRFQAWSFRASNVQQCPGLALNVQQNV